MVPCWNHCIVLFPLAALAKHRHYVVRHDVCLRCTMPSSALW